MFLVLAVLAGCATGGDVNVVDKVMYDFGLGERPEGYVATSDRIMERLPTVARTEMKRLNLEERQGDIEYQELEDLQGRYYKEVKEYVDFMPLEVNAVTGGTHGERGYWGYIMYTYRIRQSERFPTRTEAEAASPVVDTGVTDREVYRYRFSTGGVWNGRPGELSRR
jgi:hypothetical protein